jgi:hypothetical protein
MSALFTSLRVGSVELTNRVVIAPMCQYSAVNGCMTDWHLIHLGQLALSGAALLTIEATAVLPEGRITYADVGLWDEPTEAASTAMMTSVAAPRRSAISGWYSGERRTRVRVFCASMIELADGNITSRPSCRRATHDPCASSP